MPVEHTPKRTGLVQTEGEYYSSEVTCRKLESVAHDIEEHGEVHATFEGVEGEVELRLGTTRINFKVAAFEVWDGDFGQRFSLTDSTEQNGFCSDFYQTFYLDNLVSYYRPMDTYHND